MCGRDRIQGLLAPVRIHVEALSSLIVPKAVTNEVRGYGFLPKDHTAYYRLDGADCAIEVGCELLGIGFINDNMLPVLRAYHKVFYPPNPQAFA